MLCVDSLIWLGSPTANAFTLRLGARDIRFGVTGTRLPCIGASILTAYDVSIRSFKIWSQLSWTLG